MQTNWQAVLDGLLIAVVGYLVVLLSLALLYYVFRFLPKILHSRIRSRLRAMGKELRHDEDVTLVGNEGAAVAAALYLYFHEVHDEEDTVMTIKRVDKRYSPWSSKILGLKRF